MANLSNEIWAQQSVRWQNVGLPTRPTPEDIELMHSLAINQNSKLEQVAVLGVTPEIIQMRWPDSVKLNAYDLSEEMILSVWEPNCKVFSKVWHADWQSLPIGDGEIDLFIGDGCLTALAGIEKGTAVFKELVRCLKPSGRVVMRCFIRPENKEPIEEIIADVKSHKIKFFGSLKWRIAMALCDDVTSNVMPSEICRIFNESFPDRIALSRKTGWSLETINTLDSYNNMTSPFTFPSLLEIQNIVKPLFNIQEIKYGSYELSSRCPVISFFKKE